jgi:hypothetical protein
MVENGFVDVGGFVDMWEMWLGCFVKVEHKPHVSKFYADKIAKGTGRIKPGKNTLFGNKGGVA